MKRTKLHVKGHSSIAQQKQEIQALLRAIVMERDGGCILRDLRHCGGEYGIEGIVLQADHLITRSNSATYADKRLVVCVCKGCHLWKKYNKEAYDKMVKKIITKDRVHLWEVCEEDRSAHPMRSYDWSLAIVALKQDLK